MSNCQTKNKKGINCKRKCSPNDKHCWQHSKQSKKGTTPQTTTQSKKGTTPQTTTQSKKGTTPQTNKIKKIKKNVSFENNIHHERSFKLHSDERKSKQESWDSINKSIDDMPDVDTFYSCVNYILGEYQIWDKKDLEKKTAKLKLNDVEIDIIKRCLKINEGQHLSDTDKIDILQYALQREEAAKRYRRFALQNV